MKVIVNQHISAGFSSKDADILSSLIDENLNDNERIEIDFTDVKFFTTLFFNEAIMKYLEHMSVDDFNSKIIVTNLSSTGEKTFRHSYEYAVEYYALSPDEREKQNKIIDAAMDDI